MSVAFHGHLSYSAPALQSGFTASTFLELVQSYPRGHKDVRTRLRPVTALHLAIKPNRRMTTGIVDGVGAPRLGSSGLAPRAGISDFCVVRVGVPYQAMRLYEAAVACRLYSAFGGEFDDSTVNLKSRTGGALDLESDVGGRSLLTWLNEWGCRQFAKEHHSDAIDRLRTWARGYLKQLPGESTDTLDLTDAEIRRAATAYGVLKEIEASQRHKRSGPETVSVGPTGAAKIMYALRPNSLPPWDDAIRRHFEWDGSPDSYACFLRRVKGEIQELVSDASRCGVTAAAIPGEIRRTASTLPKIVDEYFWVTITRKFQVPPLAELQQWSRWGGAR